MRVLVYGVNSKNKGAELLLAAASRELAKRGHQTVVNVRDVNSGSRKLNSASGVFSIERLGPLRSGGLDILPRPIADRLPIAGDGAFDYVLDASGYSMTDAWGMAPVWARLSRLPRWKSRGSGFAMLPQAFGPFSTPDLARGVRSIIEFADVVWARDSSSWKNVQNLSPLGADVRQAPDITIPLTVGDSSDVAAGAALLVPNWNLAKRSDQGGRELYLNSLTQIAEGLRCRGVPVIGLCHEGVRDREIITEVSQRLQDMPILSPASGLECKRIIGGAEIVIAGRYHALVSALSSGVPAIGHSWSHKYAALMDDFAVSDGLANPLDASDTLEHFDNLDLAKERLRLQAAHAKVAARLETVWDTVDELIRSR